MYLTPGGFAILFLCLPIVLAFMPDPASHLSVADYCPCTAAWAKISGTNI